jgi:hypothetical protein
VRDYELMVVLDPNLDEAATDALNTRIQSLVTQRGGTVEGTDIWGRKRLPDRPLPRWRLHPVSPPAAAERCRRNRACAEAHRERDPASAGSGRRPDAGAGRGSRYFAGITFPKTREAHETAWRDSAKSS